MIVEIPECSFRISGSALDWQIQYKTKDRGAEIWKGKYFFPSLEYAISKAYELMLLESPAQVDITDVPGECRRVKDELVAAVRKAVNPCSS